MNVPETREAESRKSRVSKAGAGARLSQTGEAPSASDSQVLKSEFSPSSPSALTVGTEVTHPESKGTHGEQHGTSKQMWLSLEAGL